MSFADRLQEDVATHRGGPKCMTCDALAALDQVDLDAYHGARTGRVPYASIARALGLQPGTYSLHVRNGHDEPR